MTDPSKLIGYEAFIPLYESIAKLAPEKVKLKRVKVGNAYYVSRKNGVNPIFCVFAISSVGALPSG